MHISNIKPITDGNYNCFDKNIILTVCNFWGRDASAYFLDNALIRYSPCKDASILSNKELYFGSDNKYRLLEKYCGVIRRRTVITDSNRSNSCQALKKEVQRGNPTGVLLDAYDCHWNDYYQNIHRPHAILLIGFDSKAMEYLCIDGYLNGDIQKISEEVVYNSIYRIYEFIKTDIKEDIKCADIKVILKDSLYGVEQNSIIDGLQDIRSDIMKTEYFENDKIMFDDLNKSYFILRLRQVHWNIMTIADILANKTGKKDYVLKQQLANKYMLQSKMWNFLLSYLTKAFYSKQSKSCLTKAIMLCDDIIVNQKQILRIIK